MAHGAAGAGANSRRWPPGCAAYICGLSESSAAFARLNGCVAKPNRTELNNGELLLDTWSGGKSGTQVEIYSLPDWGHGWPKGESKVSATELIWKFFQEHARKPK